MTRVTDIDGCADALARMTGREHEIEGTRIAIARDDHAAFARSDLKVYRDSTDPRVTRRHKARAAPIHDEKSGLAAVALRRKSR